MEYQHFKKITAGKLRNDKIIIQFDSNITDMVYRYVLSKDLRIEYETYGMQGEVLGNYLSRTYRFDIPFFLPDWYTTFIEQDNN